ncbi:MAG: SDR family oxidoreductase [Candidatus Latescibacterota bacterium]|nr:SDR family oxidoreductase [Candidatus Latescibacterota bacterium]
MDRLHGHIAVVTGGSTGIGGATAEMYGQEGAFCHILDHNSEDGEAMAQHIHQNGGRAAFHKVDVRSADEVSAVFAAIDDQHHRVDLLVCSAGVLQGAYDDIADLAEDEWDATLDTNLKGTYLTTRFAAPLLRRSPRSVLMLISSGAGVRGASSSYAYAASKAGMHGMHYNLDKDLAPTGTRVHVICPGGINTPLKLHNVGQGAEFRGEDPQAAISEARENLGDPRGIARILTFLASEDGDYVRGTIFTR